MVPPVPPAPPEPPVVVEPPPEPPALPEGALLLQARHRAVPINTGARSPGTRDFSAGTGDLLRAAR
jgi:hypothetical protein